MTHAMQLAGFPTPDEIRFSIQTLVADDDLDQAADIAEHEFNPVATYIAPMSIVSGLSGVFSGFAKQVAQAAKEYNVDGRDIFFSLGKRNAVAGQESLILEVARELAEKHTAERA